MNSVQEAVKSYISMPQEELLGVEDQISQIFQTIKMNFLDLILTMLTFGAYYVFSYEPENKNLIREALAALPAAPQPKSSPVRTGAVIDNQLFFDVDI